MNGGDWNMLVTLRAFLGHHRMFKTKGILLDPLDPLPDWESKLLDKGWEWFQRGLTGTASL